MCVDRGVLFRSIFRDWINRLSLNINAINASIGWTWTLDFEQTLLFEFGFTFIPTREGLDQQEELFPFQKF